MPLHCVLLSPGCSDECVPGSHIPTLHGEPDSGQGVTSHLPPRMAGILLYSQAVSYTGLWSLARELRGS